MTITGGSGLPQEDIERMMREAEEHADEDKKRREEVEVRNQAENLVYQTEKFLSENADKVPDEAKENVTGPLDELKKSLEGEDVEAIKSASEKVAQASQALGAAMYAEAAQAADGTAGDQASGDAGEPASDDDDVVDAEIVEDEPDSGENK